MEVLFSVKYTYKGGEILLEITGTVQDVIYQNSDNGYTIAVLESDDDVVTIVGNMPLVSDGENIAVEGSFIVHKTYGEQFKVENYKLMAPSTESGVIKYLASGLLPGVGEKTAEKIVGVFGTEALDIIQYNPERLSEVEGIGKKKIEKIAESFVEQRELKEVIMYLQNFDINPNLGMKIYKKYGSETIAKVNQNPYRLSEEVYGIGFNLTDRIAQNMGISKDSGYRIKAGIVYALNQSGLDGHSYFPEQELLAKSAEILKLDRELIESGIMELAVSQKIQIEVFDGVRAVYSMIHYNAETGVSKRIVDLSQAETKPLEIDTEEEIERLEVENGMEFAVKQKKAIREAMENGVLVITGGPGTGKTTTINSIIEIFEENEQEVVLAAPTGRAAKRMSEATGREASTIHRLLEYTFGDDSIGMYFGRDDGAPIEADVIIVDEVSMVDIILMNSLLKAITPGTRLIIVGDTDQLPSVGPGNVLKDIIDSKIIPVVKLDEIFRQAKESMIIVNAHRINKGEKPLLNQKGKDFFMIRESDPEQILQTVLELARHRLPKFNGYDSLRDIQVLSCSKKGDVGVNVLNKRLQEVLNPAKHYKPEKQFGETLYRAGDKIMQIKNNYNTKWKRVNGGRVIGEGEGVFNGDMGYIVSMDMEEGELLVVFDDDREVVYKFNQLDEIKHAYATTVHKSQGSEFPVVIMPIYWGPPMLLTRNLLYTGITRAKEMVVLVGMEKYLDYMIGNDKIAERYSGLKKRLDRIYDYVVR